MSPINISNNCNTNSWNIYLFVSGSYKIFYKINKKLRIYEFLVNHNWISWYHFLLRFYTFGYLHPHAHACALPCIMFSFQNFYFKFAPNKLHLSTPIKFSTITINHPIVTSNVFIESKNISVKIVSINNLFIVIIDLCEKTLNINHFRKEGVLLNPDIYTIPSLFTGVDISK